MRMRLEAGRIRPQVRQHLSCGLQNLCCEFESYCPCHSSLVRSAATGSYFFVQLTDNTSHLLQRVAEEMDVDIVGNRHIGMSEQFWQNLNIAASLLAVGREGVPEHMLAQIGNIGLSTRQLDLVSHDLVRQRTTVFTLENIAVSVLRFGAETFEERIRIGAQWDRAVARKRLRAILNLHSAVIGDANQCLANVDCPPFPANVIPCQCQAFAHPQACFKHQ